MKTIGINLFEISKHQYKVSSSNNVDIYVDEILPSILFLINTFRASAQIGVVKTEKLFYLSNLKEFKVICSYRYLLYEVLD